MISTQPCHSRSSSIRRAKTDWERPWGPWHKILSCNIPLGKSLFPTLTRALNAPLDHGCRSSTLTSNCTIWQRHMSLNWPPYTWIMIPMSSGTMGYSLWEMLRLPLTSTSHRDSSKDLTRRTLSFTLESWLSSSRHVSQRPIYMSFRRFLWWYQTFRRVI